MTLGSQLLRAPLAVCHGDLSMTLRLLHAADAAWPSSPAAPSAKELQRGESPFPCHLPCEWLTQSDNALKSVHSHQGAVETFLTNASMVCRLEHMYYMAPGVTSPVYAPAGRTLKTIPLWDSC